MKRRAEAILPDRISTPCAEFFGRNIVVMSVRNQMAGAVFAAALSGSGGAHAAEISRTRIAQWLDPLTPPHTRTSCIRMAKTKVPFSKKWFKTCTEWKTQFSNIEVAAELVASGPANIETEVKNAVNKCFSAAAVAAVSTGLLSGSAGVPFALGAAKLAFSTCLVTSGTNILDSYDVKIETHSHWTDWR